MTNYDAESDEQDQAEGAAQHARQNAAVDFDVDERLKPTDPAENATRGQIGEHVDQETLACWNLRRIRQALGLSQQQVSDKLAELGGSRLSQSQLAKMERGERPMRVNEMFDLGAALGIHYFEFFAGQMRSDDRDLQLLAARLHYQRAVEKSERAEEAYKETVKDALRAGQKLIHTSAYLGIKDETAMVLLTDQTDRLAQVDQVMLELESPTYGEVSKLPHVQAKLAARPAQEERYRKKRAWAEEEWARLVKRAEDERAESKEE
ncbi:helix-turn-helix transcriptional regulator [Streptomyces sp. NPDC051665]|uniref:helix-turn-helix domain-containing protein n=1 Tax=Streptomyces sp. NPDC051665 TaxID=3154647 RepID=UPI00343E99FB